MDTVVFPLWAGFPVKDSVLGGVLIFQYTILVERAVESGCSVVDTFEVPCLFSGPNWQGRAQKPGSLPRPFPE